MSTISLNKRYEKRYKPSRIPQRRNPVYFQRISRFQCKYCKENVDNAGIRQGFYRSINQIWAHIIREHRHMDFKPYLMSLADSILAGDLT